MMILEVFCCGPIETNALLVGCPKSRLVAIIDAPLGSVALLENRIRELGLTVSVILLTHSHWDHIAEAALLKEKFKAPLLIHKEDVGNLESPGSDGLTLFFPIKGVSPDSFLTEGQTVTVGQLTLTVIHTPGHSPGGVCFYAKEEKVLISGDTLFRGTIGKLNSPTGQAERMWPSLKKLAALPPDVRVYPGHGESTSIREENWLARAEEIFNE